MTILL